MSKKYQFTRASDNNNFIPLSNSSLRRKSAEKLDVQRIYNYIIYNFHYKQMPHYSVRLHY